MNKSIFYISGYIILVTLSFLIQTLRITILDILLRLLPIWILAFSVIKGSGYKKGRSIFFALLFSSFGDIAGLYHQMVIQIICFALAHIFYIIFFSKHFVISAKKFPLALFLIVYVIYIGLKIIPGVTNPTLRIATTCYLLIIGTMGIFAVFQKHDFYYVFLAGVAFFFMSDSFIALNAFKSHFSNAGYWIMITYYLAQLLIAIPFFPGIAPSDSPSTNSGHSMRTE